MPEHITLLTVTTENILSISLNRPESYNAVNEAMKEGLNDALKQAEKDEGVWWIALHV
jgi:enoyl-CoA hydratase/carnithine racemase